MADTPNGQGPITPNQAQPETQVSQQPNPQLDAFARKEKQLRKMQMQMMSEKQAWEAKLKQYETDYIPRSQLKSDPLAILTNEGFSTEQLSELILNSPNMNDPTVRALMSKIKALEDKQSSAIKQQEEATKAQYQQAVKQISNEVKLLVDSDNEYSTIKEAGMHDAVVELIEQTFNNEGYLMDVALAAKQVEDYLVEEGLKLARLEKVKAKLQPPAQPVAEVPAKKQADTKLTTLTNKIPTQPSGRLSEKERKERAIAAFMGKLNQG